MLHKLSIILATTGVVHAVSKWPPGRDPSPGDLVYCKTAFRRIRTLGVIMEGPVDGWTRFGGNQGKYKVIRRTKGKINARQKTHLHKETMEPLIDNFGCVIQTNYHHIDDVRLFPLIWRRNYLTIAYLFGSTQYRAEREAQVTRNNQVPGCNRVPQVPIPPPGPPQAPHVPAPPVLPQNAANPGPGLPHQNHDLPDENGRDIPVLGNQNVPDPPANEAGNNPPVVERSQQGNGWAWATVCVLIGASTILRIVSPPPSSGFGLLVPALCLVGGGFFLTQQAGNEEPYVPEVTQNQPVQVQQPVTTQATTRPAQSKSQPATASSDSQTWLIAIPIVAAVVIFLIFGALCLIQKKRGGAPRFDDEL